MDDGSRYGEGDGNKGVIVYGVLAVAVIVFCFYFSDIVGWYSGTGDQVKYAKVVIKVEGVAYGLVGEAKAAAVGGKKIVITDFIK